MIRGAAHSRETSFPRAEFLRKRNTFSTTCPRKRKEVSMRRKAWIKGFEETQLSPSFPLISLSGYTGFPGSGSNNLPKANRIRTWQYTDSVSYASGKHDMKFGAQLYHQTHGFFNGQSQEGNFN